MQLTYKFRLRDTADSELRRQSRAVNFVWNYCNETQQKAVKRGRKWLSWHDLQKLTAGSSKELDLHAHTIQQVCQKYDISRRTHQKARLKWRGKKSLGWVPFNKGHVAYRNGSFWFRGREYKAWVSRELQEGQTFGAGSFNQDALGRWYINLPVEVEVLESAPSNAVGIDLGLKELAALSTGEKIENPRWYRASEAKLSVAQRAGKKRQAKRIHANAANQRKDFLHKASTALAKSHDIIVVGDVSSSKLSRTSMAKSVMDAGWHSFKQMLRYKSIRNGGTYVEVSERNTTRTCSSCGSVSGPQGVNGLRIRAWTCVDCGAIHDRDRNAAANILRLGLESLTEGACHV